MIPLGLTHMDGPAIVGYLYILLHTRTMKQSETVTVSESEGYKVQPEHDWNLESNQLQAATTRVCV